MSRYIDAEKLIEQYKGNILTAQTDYAQGCRDIIEDINNAPAADVQEVKHGYWSQSKKTAFSEECSVCGCTVEHNDGVVTHYPRCPFCGAKMDEKENG